MEYENIIFNPSMLIPRQNDVTATDFLLPLMSGKVTVPTIFTPVYPYYTDVIMPIDACDEISKTKPQGYELYIKSQLYQFFFILDNRCRNLTTGSNRKTLDKMKIVLKYIENNYMQKITIADIAATVFQRNYGNVFRGLSAGLPPDNRLASADNFRLLHSGYCGGIRF